MRGELESREEALAAAEVQKMSFSDGECVSAVLAPAAFSLSV